MPRVAAVLMAIICVALALGFSRPHSTPGPALRDFESYYAGGAVWNRGASPYTTQIWQIERSIPGVDPKRYELLPYVGIPQAVPLFALLARLPYPAAGVVWTTLLLCAAGVLLWATVALLGLRVGIMELAGLVLISIGFGPLTSDIALGQIAVVSAMATALTTLAFACVRPLLGGVTTLLAALQPNIALVLASQLSRRRAIGATAVAGVAFLISFVPVQRGDTLTLLRYLELLHEHGGAEAFSTIQYAPSAILHALGAPDAAAIAGGIALSLTAAVLWLAGMRTIRHDRAAALAFSCALLPLALPFFHEHDFVIVLIAALVCVRRVPERLWPLALTGSLLVAVDWLGLAERPDGAVQSALLLIAAAIGYAVFARRPLATLTWAAAPLLLLVACAVAAQSQPAPVWPDAMRPLPAFPAGVSAAMVWKTEIANSGLLIPNPFWGALRALSLLGCVVLSYVSWKSLADSKRSSTDPA